MKIHPIVIIFIALATSSSFAAKFDIKESLRHYKPILSEAFMQSLQQAEVNRGEEYFQRKCAQCHDGQKEGGHNKGPHLWNWYGRKAGGIAGFNFSQAMAASDHQWNFATLNYFLTRTDRAVPGVAMNFRGIRQDEKRAALLLYLRTLNDEPPALP